MEINAEFNFSGGVGTTININTIDHKPDLAIDIKAKLYDRSNKLVLANDEEELIEALEIILNSLKDHNKEKALAPKRNPGLRAINQLV